MSTNSTVQTLTGCVKWFNNGLNYGFITVLTEGEYRNTDVFVHQSNIKTFRDCFRTLFTGECVQFEFAKADNDKHPFHAINVHGFNGAQLRCEAQRGYSGRGRGRECGSYRNGNSQRGARIQHQTGGNPTDDSTATSTKENATVENTLATEAAPKTSKVSATEMVVSNGCFNGNDIPVESTSAPIAKGRGRGRGRGRKVSA